MANGLLAQEAQMAASGAGPAGLTGGGPPPPAQAQQPVGGAPQGQPTPGFPELCQQLVQTLLQGNEADLQVFGATVIGPLQGLVEDRQAQMQPQAPMPGAGPQGVTVP